MESGAAPRTRVSRRRSATPWTGWPTAARALSSKCGTVTSEKPRGSASAAFAPRATEDYVPKWRMQKEAVVFLRTFLDGFDEH